MPEKQKVILFLPKPRKHTFSSAIPVALLRLASMLDRSKYDPKIITATPKYDYEQKIVDESKDALCLAVGVLTGHDIEEAINVIKRVRKANPKLPIIWGGWHASIFPQQTLESEHADIIVNGQGELTFKELVEAIEKKESLEGVLGISFKKDGKIIHNPPRPFEDINKFPELPYDLIDIENYVDNFDGLRAMFYVTSQGCPFPCKYCAEPMVFKQRWSALSNDRILKDWKFFVEKHNIEFIIIGDDNFFIGEARVRDFCEKLIKMKLPLKWGRVSGRVRQMLAFKDETWQLIKDSGLTDIQIGAESGLQEVLDFVNKQMTVDEVVQFIEKTRQFGIKATPALILGLPTDKFKGVPDKEVQRQLDRQWNAMFDLLDRCYGKHRDYDEIRLFAYDPYPGNPLYDLSCELGFEAPKNLEGWSVIRPAPWIPDKLRERIKMLQYFLFPYARDAYQDRHIKKFKLLQKFFHKSAQWRWRHRFFALPLEYKMYRAYTDARTKMTGKSATEHQ